ncbi:Fic/DOC family protein [Kribbella sp. NPDC004536]|uniref:Fic/DOC family protein n=1 Tax=Kribbella sp. NPDC004536 TaxID=3364106 RepID=UPI00368D5BC2
MTTAAEEQEDRERAERWNAYLWEPGGCLRNKLGINNPFELPLAEYRLRAVRQGELDRGEVDIPRTYDKAHLQAIHKHLLQDVYDWAGEFRNVDTSKQGNAFVPAHLLDKWTGKVSAKVRDRDWSTMSREEFVQSAADVYAYLNLTHPFREGNGAAAKVFLNHVAEMSPYRLDFDRVEKSEWYAASDAAYPEDITKSTDPDPRKLYAVFDKATVERGSVVRADPELAMALELQSETYAGVDESEQLDIDDKRPADHAVLEAEAEAEHQA